VRILTDTTPCCGQVLLVLVEQAPPETAGGPSSLGYPLDKDGLPRPQSATLDEIIRRQEAQEAAGREAWAHAAAVAAQSPAIDPDEPGYRADGLVCEIDPQVEAYEIPAEDPPPLPQLPKWQEPRLPSLETRPPRVRDEETRRRERERYRLKRPLRMPTTYEGRRLMAWTFYRLKALDLQLQAEIEAKVQQIARLRGELAGVEESPESEQASLEGTLPRIQLQGEAKKIITMRRRRRVRLVIDRRDAHADEGMAPKVHEAHERGPP